MKIMIIDDSPSIIRTISRMLRDHVVVGESDPRAALARLRDGECFDFILCDLRMPVLDGIAVLEAVRSSFRDDAPMLILMTGGDDQVGAAADAVLAKPFSMVDLHAVLKRLTKKAADRSFAATRPLPILGAA